MPNSRRSGTDIIWEGDAVFATPYKYIALMFAVRIRQNKHYSSATPLNAPERNSLMFFGPKSLQDCLDKFFAPNVKGYLYEFPANMFVHEKGLASGEVISRVPVAPIAVLEFTGPQILKALERMNINFLYGGRCGQSVRRT